MNPTQPLPDNELINIISVIEGNPIYKWAFETEKMLSVKSVYPSDGTTYAEPSTGIEVTLTYPNINNFEDCFTITDNIKGTFEQKGYVYRFIPEKKLEKGKKYTVTIQKGLTNGVNTMDTSYNFSFIVSDANYSYDSFSFTSQSLDSSLTFTPDVIPQIGLLFENPDNNKLYKETIANIKLYKIEDIDQYISLVSNEQIDFKELSIYDEFSGNIVKYDNSDYHSISSSPLAYIEYPKLLEVGNYLVLYTIGDKQLHQSLQISNIVAYFGNSANDVIAWINDYRDSKSAVEANVSFKSKVGNTNEDGISILRNVMNSDLSNYAKVTYNGEEIAILLNNYQANYYKGFVYTDRLLYKTTDIINVWGVVPTNNIVNNYQAEIRFEDRIYPVTLNENGTFTTEISLYEHEKSYPNIQLYYNNVLISSRSISIEEYAKPNYIYSITTNQEYYYINDEINVNVSVEHISGIKAANKQLNVIYDGKNISCFTDDNGECTVKFSAVNSDNNYSTNITTQSIRVLAYDAVDSSDLCHKTIELINEKEQLNVDSINEDGYKIKVNGYSLNIESGLLNRKQDVGGEIIVYIYKNHCDVVKKVDDYTKETYNTLTNYTSNIIDTKTYKINNGYAEITDLEYPTIDNDEKYESYTFKLKLKNSNISYQTYYKDKKSNEVTSNNSLHISCNPTGISSAVGAICGEITPESYLSYYFPNLKTKYSIDDKIDIKVNNYSNETVNGKKLVYFFGDNILDYYIDAENATYVDNYFPGINIAGAVVDNNKINMIDAKYLDFNELDRQTNIEIIPNKELYSPNDEVTLDIKVTDAKGNPISGDVLISVVDEGVFALREDYIYLLNQIYVNKTFPFYQISTRQDLLYSYFYGGFGAAAARSRSDFGDTVYFKNIVTDNNGKAKVTFKLNDSVTTFRITALSSNKDLYVGDTKIKIKSQLPHFIESYSLNGFKSSDDIVSAVNTISNAKMNVNYEFKLDGTSINNAGLTNAYLYQNFGKLSAGDHTLKIISKADENEDSVEYNFKIKDYYQNIRVENEMPVENKNYTFNSNSKNVQLDFYDKSLNFYLTLMNKLRFSNYERVDRYAAIKKSTDIYNKLNNTELTSNIVIPSQFIKDNKILLSENSEFSPLLNALMVNYVPNLLNTNNVTALSDDAYGYFIKNDNTEPLFYDYVLLNASLKNISLEELNKFSSENIVDNIELALAYAFMGDYNKATIIYDEKIKNDPDYKLNKELIAILLSMIYPNECKDLLVELENEENKSEYYTFAVISYLQNTIPLIEEIKFSVNDNSYSLNKLSVKSVVLSKEEAMKVNISSTSNTTLMKKVFVGNSDEIEKSSKKFQVKMNVKDKLKLNANTTLEIVVSSLPYNSCGMLYVTLPKGLRYYSANIKDDKDVYLISNDGNNLTYNVCTNNSSTKNLDIPIISVLPGNFTMESVVYNQYLYYGVSEKIILDIEG